LRFIYSSVEFQATDSIFKRKRKLRARKRGRRAGVKVQARRRRACEHQQQIIPCGSSNILAEVLAQALQGASLMHEDKHDESELINLATSNDNDTETVIISPHTLPIETIDTNTVAKVNEHEGMPDHILTAYVKYRSKHSDGVSSDVFRWCCTRQY
jgi:hypothetical protein